MHNYLSKNKMKFISGIVVVVKLTRWYSRFYVHHITILLFRVHYILQQTAQDLGSVARLITSTTSKTLMKI
jgi:hypothetical protein